MRQSAIRHVWRKKLHPAASLFVRINLKKLSNCSFFLPLQLAGLSDNWIIYSKIYIIWTNTLCFTIYIIFYIYYFLYNNLNIILPIPLNNNYKLYRSKCHISLQTYICPQNLPKPLMMLLGAKFPCKMIFPRFFRAKGSEKKTTRSTRLRVPSVFL